MASSSHTNNFGRKRKDLVSGEKEIQRIETTDLDLDSIPLDDVTDNFDMEVEELGGTQVEDVSGASKKRSRRRTSEV